MELLDLSRDYETKCRQLLVDILIIEVGLIVADTGVALVSMETI